eukprot:TRINITY_DN55154_c0_g1_i1.p1 TRINITY_DN55154_c0_g1~~TRINITY_DN55154_c0_g1_i1.p1  ORF type:complete len:1000 (-),score=187.82 TRINITY_DN55154_c0_g1_i1:255-3206(-)
MANLLQLALGALSLAAAAGKVLVHLVPHTHDDAGWLKTVDQYLSGQNNSIQHANVKLILDTVVDSLQKNPDRKFTYVEIAFFARWWHQQSESVREVTRQLVRNGQLSFANGGWCMHDEAAPFYLDMIDQTTEGHRFLMENLGFSPKTGWQLDPFGHSATQAALLSSEVGFNGLFFGRIDYQDLAARVENKAAEFVWRASPSLGKDAQVFSGLTGSYGGNYGPPQGFDWDVRSDDEPVQDDPSLNDYNVKSRVDDFVRLALWQANHTRGNNIMWTMGSDFQYEDAASWFVNLDRIIKHVNEDGRVMATYSTPDAYVAAKMKEKSVEWPLKTDDFFPYADGPHKFWTGYFTSRPAFKRYIRDSSAILQAVRQLGAVSSVPAASRDLAEAMGLAQHHDGVSGTAKQHVTFDYAQRIAKGRAKALPAAAAALAQLTGLHVPEGQPFLFCDLRNVSVCSPTQTGLQDGQEVLFVLWNGLAQSRSELVELPIELDGAHVLDMDGREVPSQVVASLQSITNYGKQAGGAKNLLLFKADVPPMGYRAFRLASSASRAKPKHELLASSDSYVIENDFLALHFCDGALCQITDKKLGTSTKASQSWFWYTASTGSADNNQASGAYIFRSNSSTATPAFAGKPTLRVVRGPLADEVHQDFGPWISQRIRLEKGARHAEITYTVGPIPVADGVGKEVVSRFTTDIQNAGEYFVDSNGREMLSRKRDFRPSWNFNQTEPVAGNYYPVTTSSFIKDAHTQLTVLIDSAQAGSGCIRDGELELMVHRRLLKDDGRGVGEPLNETQFVKAYVSGDKGQHYGPGLVVRGRHLVMLSTPAEAAKAWRPLADQVYMPLHPFFAHAGSKLAPERETFSALSQPLPANVQLVSLERWDEQRLLIRLAHQYGIGEDADLSRPASLDFRDVFAGRRIARVDERGLAAAISREEVLKRRVAWNVEGEQHSQSSQGTEQRHGADVTLGPLQIRTFLITFATEAEPVFV